MSSKDFFEEPTELSQVKSEIVSKYFDAWAKVMIGVLKKTPGRSGGRIAYVDLFCGPGRYTDGSPSTPILVLEKAVRSAELRVRLLSIFNDRDESAATKLRSAIAEVPGIDTLMHRPQVTSNIVGEEIAQLFERTSFVPTLFFADPWGYRGLSLRLVGSLLKDWGSDCILFFNYARINMALVNPLMRAHMDGLFGNERAEALREKLGSMRPDDRELEIIEEISLALADMGGKYVLPFRFVRGGTSRTSHHLIFVSKGFRGYEIMKEIMAKEASAKEQGVPVFEYNPASARQPLLFGLTRPLDSLADMLLVHFAGQTLAMKTVYEQHNVGTPFIKRNYKDALAQLEASSRIVAVPPCEKRRRGTFANDVVVIFPPTGR
jgi:three-Cys-motif partner protein